jgi:putative alpha-1,2-mannosidase
MFIALILCRVPAEYPQSPSLGNFPIFPQAICPGDDVNQCKFMQSDRALGSISGTVEAHPGYFAITLNSSIRAEMTVTNHTALYRFTFPDPAKSGLGRLSPLILVDLVDLPMTRSYGSASVDPKTGRFSGSGTFMPSFGTGNYKLYFCIDFSGAAVRDTGTWLNGKPTTQPSGGAGTPVIVTYEAAGVWTRFQPPTSNNQILARVGMSFKSVDQACSNAEKEVPGFDFDAVRAAAEDRWRQKLGVIQIDATDVSDGLQKAFWSDIYRSMISPQDYTGENPLWESNEPYYDSYYWYVLLLAHVDDHNHDTHFVQHLGLIPECSPSTHNLGS